MANLTQDRISGFILIALGVAALLFQPFDKVNDALQGTADAWLTFILIVLAVGAIGVAIFGQPSLKALAIFWIVTP